LAALRWKNVASADAIWRVETGHAGISGCIAGGIAGGITGHTKGCIVFVRASVILSR